MSVDPFAVPERKTKFSVIMPVWNRLETVKLALPSVIEHTDWERAEMIVVENGSDAATRFYVRRSLKELPQYRLLQNRVNAGVSRGWNLGLRIAEGHTLIVIGSDIIVPAGWVEELDALLNVPKVGCVALCVVTDILDKCTQRAVGTDGTVARISGGNVGGPTAFRRQLHQKIGYYCEDFGLYGEEDADWGWRVRCCGLLNVYSDKLMATHIGYRMPGDEIYKDQPARVKLLTEKIHGYNAGGSLHVPYYTEALM